MEEQKEKDGKYTKIYNYILPPLYQCGLSPEFQILIFIFYKTIVFEKCPGHKDFPEMSNSYISDNILYSERTVKNALKKLKERNFIKNYKQKTPKGYINSWKINFKFSEWITPNKSKNGNQKTENGNQEEPFISDQEITPLELKRHILEFAPGRMIYFKYDDYIIDGIRKDNNTVELLNKSNEMILYSIDHIKLSDLQK